MSELSARQIEYLTKKAADLITRSQSNLRKKELKRRDIEGMGNELLSICREIVANIHSNRIRSAAALLRKLYGRLGGFLKIIKSNELSEWGYSVQVLQECLEASCLHMILVGVNSKWIKVIERFPEQSILYGFSDLIGELRRLVLREIAMGNTEEAKAFASIMIELHSKLERAALANSVAPGLRRKLDANRVAIDLTLSQLSEEESRKRLVKSIESLKSMMEELK